MAGGRKQEDNVLWSICVLLNRRSVVVFPGTTRPKWQETTTVPLMAMWFSGGCTGLRCQQKGICIGRSSTWSKDGVLLGCYKIFTGPCCKQWFPCGYIYTHIIVWVIFFECVDVQRWHR